MRIQVLGCSGAIAHGCRTTSFLVDDDVLLDAGTGVGDLSLEQMRRIRYVLLTHAHLDHIAALPLMIDAIGGQLQCPIEIYALAGTLEALKNHIFNDVIWPDFSRIPSSQAPFIRFQEIHVGQQLQLGGKQIEVLPAVHTVPAVGYAIGHQSGQFIFSGDTGANPAFWQRVRQLPVEMLVIETAFSNRESELAQRSLHLSPRMLAQELLQLDPTQQFPIYITHTKPAETDLIMAEIQAFAHDTEPTTHRPYDIRWLSAGAEFNL